MMISLNVISKYCSIYRISVVVPTPSAKVRGVNVKIQKKMRTKKIVLVFMNISSVVDDLGICFHSHKKTKDNWSLSLVHC